MVLSKNPIDKLETTKRIFQIGAEIFASKSENVFIAKVSCKQPGDRIKICANSLLLGKNGR